MTTSTDQEHRGASPAAAILKGAGARCRRRAGSGAITGFPAVHLAQEPVTLRYLGTAVNQSDRHRQEGRRRNRHHDRVHPGHDRRRHQARRSPQPNSFDIVDTEYFSLKKLVPSGNLQGMDAKKIKNADKITPVFTKGEVARQEDRRPGHGAEEGLLPRGQELDQVRRPRRPQWITLIPTVYNADTLGIRPDLIKRPIESWKELLNPEFKGKASILNIPSIGIMDAAMVVEAMGEYKYPDKGNMTKEEIDLHDQDPDRGQEGRPVPRASGRTSTRSVNLMASGETVIQSMWSPAVTDGALARASPASTSR